VARHIFQACPVWYTLRVTSHKHLFTCMSTLTNTANIISLLFYVFVNFVLHYNIH
jgi:spore germination protein YaaH